MAIAFVKKTPNATSAATNSGATALSTGAFGSNVSIGNIVIVAINLFRDGSLPDIPTISDTGSNTWYIDKNQLDGSNAVRTIIAHCYPSSAAAINITATCSNANWIAMGAAEFSGVATGLTAGASGSNGGTGTSTSPSTGALAVSGNNLYIGNVCFATNNCTPNASYTQLHENENQSYNTINWEYLISSGSQTPTWTLGSSVLWITAGVAFAEAGAGSYTILYDGNGNTGGSNPTDVNSPYIDGSTVTVLGYGTLVRSGYVFSKWNTASNGTGTDYDPSDTFEIHANTTLYAQWTAQYTVTYNGNNNTGGSVPTDSNKYINGESVTVLENSGNLVRLGYVFYKWNAAADGSGTYYAAGDTFNIATDTTLYAIWAKLPPYGSGGYSSIFESEVIS